MDLEEFIVFLDEKAEENKTVLDDKLGEVFYPCFNAIEEGLNRSMA